MRLVQLTSNGDDIGLYNFPTSTSDERIEELYKEYSNQEEFEDFEEFLENKYSHGVVERVFVDEIYV